jgi:hypothetical protein
MLITLSKASAKVEKDFLICKQIREKSHQKKYIRFLFIPIIAMSTNIIALLSVYKKVPTTGSKALPKSVH